MHVTARTATGSSRSAEAENRRVADGLLALLRHLWTYDRGGGFLQVIEESGLTLTQVKALLALDSDEADPRPIRDLADELGIAAPAATRAVDALVDRGLVSRGEDPDDRRVRRIGITERGQRLVDELASRRVAGLEAYAEGLGAGQRRKLLTALDALLEDEDFASIQEASRRRARR